MALTGVLVAVILVCALQAIRAKRLIVSALWLAGTSALLSVLFYLLGAYLVAVIELSVGAGLVTVLFAFAISIAGEEVTGLRSVVPRPVAGILVLAVFVLVGALSMQFAPDQAVRSEPALSSVMWEQRGLDVLVQLMVIFAGVLGLLGLLAEAKAPLQYPVAEEFAEKRERDLDELHRQTQEEEPELEAV